MIIVNDSECRNLQQQVAKNANDIAAIHKDQTVTIYKYYLTNDADPNIHTQFSGTITLIGNVVINVIGVVIQEDTTTYPVVAFNQIDTVKQTIRITGYKDYLIDIDINDYDDMREYKLY